MINNKKYETEIKKLYTEKGVMLTDEEFENISDDLINIATLLVKDYLNKTV